MHLKAQKSSTKSPITHLNHDFISNKIEKYHNEDFANELNLIEKKVFNKKEKAQKNLSLSITKPLNKSLKYNISTHRDHHNDEETSNYMSYLGEVFQHTNKANTRLPSSHLKQTIVSAKKDSKDNKISSRLGTTYSKFSVNSIMKSDNRLSIEVNKPSLNHKIMTNKIDLYTIQPANKHKPKVKSINNTISPPQKENLNEKLIQSTKLSSKDEDNFIEKMNVKNNTDRESKHKVKSNASSVLHPNKLSIDYHNNKIKGIESLNPSKLLKLLSSEINTPSNELNNKHIITTKKKLTIDNTTSNEKPKNNLINASPALKLITEQVKSQNKFLFSQHFLNFKKPINPHTQKGSKNSSVCNLTNSNLKKDEIEVKKTTNKYLSNNSKSISKVEEIFKPQIRDKLYGVSKKAATGTNSPRSALIKSLSSNKHIATQINEKEKAKEKEKENEMSNNRNVFMKNKSIKSTFLDFIEEEKKLNNNENNNVDISVISIRSTIREGNFYRQEYEKLCIYIKEYYEKFKEYPKSSLLFYKYGRLLGKGAFGKVNLALHVGSGRLVAIKSFNKSKLQSESARRKIAQETNILKKVKHPCIVNIYESFENDRYIFIVMEYVSCGDLLNFVRKRSKLTENTAKYIFKQIIETLRFIHSNKIVHRDIKLDNILIDLSNQIKICDFGISRVVRNDDLMHDKCGTPAYIAPEILMSNGYKPYPADIWSAGVVLYAMLSGTVPFKANNMNELHRLILSCNYAKIPDISQDANHLIKCLLTLDPNERIDIQGILNHPWITSLDEVKASKTTLFTAAEHILLSKINIDYRKANRDEICENFTLKNLDTNQETENKNINTKSHILAPFNSSLKSNISSSLTEGLKIENNIMRMHGKVKELNRNYELNNNGEIDNGIIISPQIEKESFSKNPSPFIYSPLNNSFSKKPSKLNSKLISKNPTKPISKVSSTPTEKVSQTSTIYGSIRSNTSTVDINILKEIENLGYTKAYLQKCLQNNEMNYATTTYYLLQNLSNED